MSIIKEEVKATAFKTPPTIDSIKTSLKAAALLLQDVIHNKDSRNRSTKADAIPVSKATLTVICNQFTLCALALEKIEVHRRIDRCSGKK
jgi:hypothetical protein